MGLCVRQRLRVLGEAADVPMPLSMTVSMAVTVAKPVSVTVRLTTHCAERWDRGREHRIRVVVLAVTMSRTTVGVPERVS